MQPGSHEPIDPRTVYVLVVGIDRYAAGPQWDLAGPVDDAARFCRLFLARGVPAAQITLLLAPGVDAGEVAPAGIDVRSADRATIRDMLLRELPARGERCLYVVWGGHGFVDTSRRRRLYYADASLADPGDLDLDSMLATFASDLVPGFDRQIWVVDACQTHEPTAGPGRTAGYERFPDGTPVPGRTQDVLFAAGFGQSAANLRVRRTGLFSREVLRLLESPATPDLWLAPGELVARLRERFTALRAQGLTAQTPTYFWFRNGLGDEGLVLQKGSGAGSAVPIGALPGAASLPTGVASAPRPPGASAPLPPGTSAPLPPGTSAPLPPGTSARLPPGAAAALPSPARLRPVIDALLDIEEFRRPQEREEVLTLLRKHVYSAIPRHLAARPEAFSVVRTCLRFPGGLAELIEAVRFFATDDTALDRFEAAALELSQP